MPDPVPNDLVCGVCYALVQHEHIADHERWHEQEAERVRHATANLDRREGRPTMAKLSADLEALRGRVRRGGH